MQVGEPKSQAINTKDNNCKDVKPTYQILQDTNNQIVEVNDLESEVAALREENQRLQEESQSAAQQLRRFTEWFFQSVQQDDQNVVVSQETNLST